METDATSRCEKERQKKLLMQEIEEEERLIRIYEADLNWAKSRRRSHPLSNNEDEDDWLSMLDTLHSKHHPNETNFEWDHRWHDDPLIYGILPYVSGILFDSAKPVDDHNRTNSAGFSGTIRSFEFRGHVCAMRATALVFHVSISVSLPFKREEPTEITTASLNFPQIRIDHHEELQEISRVAGETRNLPLAFRQIVGWAKFDTRRTRVLLDHASVHPSLIQRLNPFIFRLSLSEQSACYVDIMWKWQVRWDSSGVEKLSIAPHINSGSLICSDIDVLSSKGLQHLIEVCENDCQMALTKILQTLTQESQPENDHRLKQK